MEVQSIQSNRSAYSVSSVTEGGDESLIFERNVEEPFIPVATDCRACGICSTAGSRSSSVVNIVSYASPQQAQQQPCKHSVHHNLENLIAPALDASANIVEDQGTNLNNVEMICSKRPSTIGLNMALGRTRTNSLTGFANDSDAQSPVSVHSISAGGNSDRHKVLSFYSYVDMLSNESPYQANFTNPFILSAGTNRRNSGSSGMLPPFRRMSHVQNVRTSNSLKSTRVGDFSIGPPGND